MAPRRCRPGPASARLLGEFRCRGRPPGPDAPAAGEAASRHMAGNTPVRAAALTCGESRSTWLLGQ